MSYYIKAINRGLKQDENRPRLLFLLIALIFQVLGQKLKIKVFGFLRVWYENAFYGLI